MSTKLKVLGMGLLAVLATSAFAVMNASATTTGHFTSSVEHTTIVGTEGGEHHQHLFGDFGEGSVGCTKASYHGTATGTTTESITITPTYEDCHTTPGPTPKVEVTTNECNYTFTVTRTASPNHPDIKVHLTCPTSKGIEVHHPNCTITILPQTVEHAGTYTQITTGGREAITINTTAKFNTQYHGGICIFLGTNHTGELKGSATVAGQNTAGEAVDITAT